MRTKRQRVSSLLSTSINRRNAVKGGAGLTLATSAGIPFTRLSFAQDGPEEIPQGGTLRVAIVGEPPAVADGMFSTATVTTNISGQIFEGLFAFDSSFNARPHLVEDYDVSDDGLTYTFRLRDGVMFHDGSELTAEDVVASLNRWGRINGRGQLIFERLSSLEATDNLTVTMVLDTPAGVLTSYLARLEAFILPAAIADATGEDQLAEDQFIGTGPFRFVEHAVDQYIRLERFDDYASRDEEPDGPSGRRTAYLDAIELIPVPDESVRANGILSGEYHFGDPLPPDFYDSFEMDPSVEPVVVKPYYWYAPVFNKAEGLFTDSRMRKAVQLAFSESEALKAGFGRDELIRVDPSISGEETAWYSTAGADDYDVNDPDRARALLDEAGYNGETVRWIATREYAYNYLIADFVKQQLEGIGMPVEVIVQDWATLTSTRADPTAYDIFLTGFSQFAHPAAQVINSPTWPGWWESEEKDAAVTDMMLALNDEEMASAIDRYTESFWSELPAIKLGDNFVFRGKRSEVVGYTNFPDWYFWNVGLDE